VTWLTFVLVVDVLYLRGFDFPDVNSDICPRTILQDIRELAAKLVQIHIIQIFSLAMTKYKYLIQPAVIVTLSDLNRNAVTS